MSTRYLISYGHINMLIYVITYTDIMYSRTYALNLIFLTLLISRKLSEFPNTFLYPLKEKQKANDIFVGVIYLIDVFNSKYYDNI